MYVRSTCRVGRLFRISHNIYNSNPQVVLILVIYPYMKGFINFIREQGVVGLAVGFILGSAVSKVVTALVTDLINPFVGLALGAVGNLKEASWKIGTAKVMWGDFVSVAIDFVIIAAVVYFGVKGLKLDKLDKKKE